MSTDQEIGVVCAYFNPMGWASRLRNYLAFRKAIAPTLHGAPLVTLELSSNGRGFEVPECPAVGPVLRFSSPDVLWQKERLLNLGATELIKQGYRKIVWLDADIEMGDPLWLSKTSACLDGSVLCQVFSESARETRPGRFKVRRGVAREYLERGTIRLHGLSCGYGWAARSELLSEVPLYDAAILGGGDAAIWLGALSGIDRRRWNRALPWIRFYRSLGRELRDDYLEWALRFGRAVAGRVGYVDQRVTSAFHGSVRDRRYGSRYSSIPDFSPRHHLEDTPDHCWRWRPGFSDRLGARVESYFKNRREDS